MLLGSGPVADETTSGPELNLADALQRGIGARLDRRFAGVHRRIYLAVVLLIAALAAGACALWFKFESLKDEIARVKADAAAISEQTADQKARLDRLDRKLDDSLAETVRAIRAFADQAARLDRLGEKLDKNLADSTRTVSASTDQTARLDALGEKLDKNLADTKRAIQESGSRVETAVSTVAQTRTAPFAAMTLSTEEREVIRKFLGVRKKAMRSPSRQESERSRRVRRRSIRCRACSSTTSPRSRTTASSRTRPRARSSSSGRRTTGSWPSSRPSSTGIEARAMTRPGARRRQPQKSRNRAMAAWAPGRA